MKFRIWIPVLTFLLCITMLLGSCNESTCIGNVTQTEDGLWLNDLITVSATPDEATEPLTAITLEFRNDTDYEVKITLANDDGQGTCVEIGNTTNGWNEAPYALDVLDGTFMQITYTMAPHTTYQYQMNFAEESLTNKRTYCPLTAGNYRLRFSATVKYPAEIEQRRQITIITYVTVSPEESDP